ncbi:transposase domain-containing protein [Citreicella sp. C3M06]|uniref:transposase domain-containing protein n=1 Tax=Citreicella sp. C3M06 TaxID=2841564 RepID=UPI002090F2D2|nr:transposase domain-containing protein [Citreicella sp. C3M06]
MASLFAAANINGVEPFAYLKATLEAIAAGHPNTRIDDPAALELQQVKHDLRWGGGSAYASRIHYRRTLAARPVPDPDMPGPPSRPRGHELHRLKLEHAAELRPRHAHSKVP